MTNVLRTRREWRALPRMAGLALAAVIAASCDSTAPPKATSIVLMGGATIGIVNQPMDPSPSFEIRDEKGNRMGGVAFTVVVNGGAGTVATSPTRTGGDGPTSVGTWTLGTATGAQSIQVQTSGLPALTISATAQPGTPTNTSSGGGPLTANGLVGAVAVIQPSIQVRDAFGNAVSGVTVNVTTTGGGTVQTTNPVTNALGVASAGIWTLGTTAGEQTARLSIGQTAPVVLFRVQAEAGAPASASAATAQTTVNATVGQPVQLTPSIRVTDQFGNGISGIAVSAVASAGSSITSPNSVTNSSGVASAGLWSVGADPGQYTVTMTAPGLAPVVFTANATAPPPSQFNISVRYIGTPPSAPIQAAFASALARVEQAVIQDLPDVPVANLNYATVCEVAGAPVVNEVVDDLLIFVVVGPIDGPGGIIASARPCILRSASSLPLIGDILMDVADLNAYAADGRLPAVVLHEVLHVLGIGTVWSPCGTLCFSLTNGLGGADPQYTGANARAAYSALGGPAGNPTVPVENSGGGGTRDAHWRESRFDVELMTGFVEPAGVAMPLSALSLGVLADFGYGVNLAAADPYVVSPGPMAAALRATVTKIAFGNDVRSPLYVIDSTGRLIAIRDLRAR